MDQKAKILDIAMNLTRIGNWAADGYQKKQKRIRQFLDQISQQIEGLEASTFSGTFKKTLNLFLQEYWRLKSEEKKGLEDELFWAEEMMTWGNILTHRTKLI